MAKVYVVEDDEDIRELVTYALKSSGFEAMSFDSGNAFFKKLSTDAVCPSIVLLDIMLPGDDGYSILKKLRSSSQYKTLPVIMLTAKTGEFDKVKGLDMGADDYITKPFGIMELISRINAVLRRSEVNSEAGALLTYKNIAIDTERHAVMIDGEKINLTYKEYELLHYFLLNPDIVLKRDKLIETVWGYEFEGESRTVDMHIKTLRQKLGVAGDNIKTIRNVGYKIGE